MIGLPIPAELSMTIGPEAPFNFMRPLKPGMHSQSLYRSSTAGIGSLARLVEQSTHTHMMAAGLRKISAESRLSTVENSKFCRQLDLVFCLFRPMRVGKSYSTCCFALASSKFRPRDGWGHSDLEKSPSLKGDDRLKLLNSGDGRQSFTSILARESKPKRFHEKFHSEKPGHAPCPGNANDRT